MTSSRWGAYRAQLQGMLDAARQAVKEQTATAAAKQDATQRLNDFLTEGRKLATFLRGVVKQRYGESSSTSRRPVRRPVRRRSRPRRRSPRPRATAVHPSGHRLTP
jgi:hypothetical protein